MFQALKDFIAARVYANGNNEISGTDVRESLDEIVDILGTHTYKGQAIPTTSPSSEERQIYSASVAGTYTNFDLIEVVAGELCFLKYDGVSWEKIILVDIAAVSVDVEVDGTSVFGSGVIGDELSALWTTDGNNVKVSRFGSDLMSLIYKDNSGGGISPESPEVFQVLSIAGGKSQPTIIMDGDEDTGIGLIGGINSPFDGTPIPLRLAIWIEGTIRLMVGADGIRVTSLIAANDSTDTPTNFLFADAAGNVYRKPISSLSGALTEEKAYVSDVHGDDVTGEYGKSGSPFKTVDAAITNMAEGGTLVILDGSHTVSQQAANMFSIDAKKGTNITFSVKLFPDILTYSGDLFWSFDKCSAGASGAIAGACDVTGIVSFDVIDLGQFTLEPISISCNTYLSNIGKNISTKIGSVDAEVANIIVKSTEEDVSLTNSNTKSLSLKVGSPNSSNLTIANTTGVSISKATLNVLNLGTLSINDSSTNADHISILGELNQVSISAQNSAKVYLRECLILNAVNSIVGDGELFASSVLAKSPSVGTVVVKGSGLLIDPEI
jgi:hypothetical protein